jgi:hypothetical protein
VDEVEEESGGSRAGAFACGCGVVATLVGLAGLAVLVGLVVLAEPIQDLWRETAADVTEPPGYRSSTFTTWHSFDCGRTDCPWRYSATDDLVVVEQHNLRASLLHPDGHAVGAEQTDAKLTMACIPGHGEIQVYVYFRLKAPRVIRPGTLVKVMSDRDRRPGDEILTFRSGLANPLRSYEVPARMVPDKAGEFRLIFEDDSMITDWMNAWSLWVVVPASDGWRAGAIFDLLHSTRHTNDMMYWCE